MAEAVDVQHLTQTVTRLSKRVKLHKEVLFIV